MTTKTAKPVTPERRRFEAKVRRLGYATVAEFTKDTGCTYSDLKGRRWTLSMGRVFVS